MARGGAPHFREQREPDILDERKDVLVKVPPVVIGRQSPPPGASDKEIIQMQQALIKELERECEVQKITASTISVTACALIKALCDGTGIGISDDAPYTICVPRQLFEHLRGAELEIANWQKGNVGDVFARIVPKSDAPRIGGN